MLSVCASGPDGTNGITPRCAETPLAHVPCYCLHLVHISMATQPERAAYPQVPTPFPCTDQGCVTQCGGYCEPQFGCICPVNTCTAWGLGSCNWYNSVSQFCQCEGGTACGKRNLDTGQCQDVQRPSTPPSVTAPAPMHVLGLMHLLDVHVAGVTLTLYGRGKWPLPPFWVSDVIYRLVS